MALELNHFFLQGNVISTPLLTGTILPGITRKSVIGIAQNLGFQVTHWDIHHSAIVLMLNLYE